MHQGVEDSAEYGRVHVKKQREFRPRVDTVFPEVIDHGVIYDEVLALWKQDLNEVPIRARLDDVLGHYSGVELGGKEDPATAAIVSQLVRELKQGNRDSFIQLLNTQKSLRAQKLDSET